MNGEARATAGRSRAKAAHGEGLGDPRAEAQGSHLPTATGPERECDRELRVYQFVYRSPLAMTDRDPSLDRWLRTLRTLILPRPTKLTPEQRRARDEAQRRLRQQLKAMAARHAPATHEPTTWQKLRRRLRLPFR